MWTRITACILLLPLHFTTTIVDGLFVPRVLYESNRILAIDKPTGIAHHNDDATGELGIVSQLREFYESTESGGNQMRLYGVHRLDRVTSGILIFAKDSEMAGILSKTFREKTALKYYIGISHRKPKKKKQGWVSGNMVRGRRKSWYLENSTKKGPDYAQTRFFSAGLGELGDSCLSEANDDDEDAINTLPKTCLLFRPHTGKTHQLRVAAKSLGLPLLGDPIYSGDAVAGADKGTNVPRTFLHAAAIHLPLSGFGDKGDPTQRTIAATNPTETSSHDSVTIWCPPPFARHLWEENVHDDFDQITRKLFDKHCESPEILSALR